MTQTIMAAAEATDCSKSQLISLPQMHERSHITISARSVTVNVQGLDRNVKQLAIYVNIWHYTNIQKLINCADMCVQIVFGICCQSSCCSALHITGATVAYV